MMEIDYNNSDTDSDDVFMGPITKREIVARLKYYKILSDEYLEPISDLKKTDVVDEDLVAFYWNIFTSRENMACSENPKHNRSVYQNLEQRKSLYNVETEQNVSIKRFNTPADSFQTEISNTQSESFNDSLNINRDSLHKPNCCALLKENSQLELNDSVNNVHEVSNCSVDEESIITISDDSYVSNHMENETLEEIQIKLEDITNEEIESQDIENHVSNYFKFDEIINTKEQNTLENDGINLNHLEVQLSNSLKINETREQENPNTKISLPVEMSILSDTFITKNSDLENYCPISSPICEEENECFNKENSYYNGTHTESSVQESLNKESPINNCYNKESSVNESYNNESFNNDSFNDTLEEMEMLMKFGENYMKQKQQTIYRDTSASNSSRSNISEGFSESKEIYEKISKQNTPSSSKYSSKNEACTPSVIEKTALNMPLPKTPSVLKPDNNIDTHFKIPGKAPPSARKSPNYKNIVSPISLYIKNSPKVPLIKKVNTPTVHSATYRELESKKSTEKSQEKAIPSHSALPIRTYKLAAKNIFLSKENEPHIPNNIRKLIKGPLNPEIIKHVGRVKATPDLQASPSANFSNHADLTILSSTSASEGIFNMSTSSEGDVSLYVSKNAARTNFSTKK